MIAVAPTPFSQVWHVEKYVENAWFPAVCVAIRVHGKRVWLVSVHLHPPYGADDKPGLFAMSESAPIRLRETQFIIAQLDKIRSAEDCVIVAGDMNESDTYASNVYLRDELGMRDALELYQGHTHWWPLRRLWGNRFLVLRSRLDHVFYDPLQMCCTGVQVLQGILFVFFFASIFLRDQRLRGEQQRPSAGGGLVRDWKEPRPAAAAGRLVVVGHHSFRRAAEPAVRLVLD